MSGDIAVGVKVFSRTEKLQNLLESIEQQDIGAVYVADDGEMTEEKSTLYGQDFEFDLTVYDLPYDAGLGYGRAHIVENFTEEYLLVVDSDHELIGDVTILRDQLEASESLGGVGGLLYEHERIAGTCHNLHENGDVLIRTVRDRPATQMLSNHPFVPFDFIPNVALFKRSCLEDYCWDPEYVIGKEHLDFYIGHKRQTDWQFGVCPTVLFGHYPGGDSAYIENRESYQKLQNSRSYFLEKWGYEQILLGYTDWESPPVHEPSLGDIGTDIVKQLLLAAPESVQKHLMRVRNSVRRYRSLPPL
jgi:glycosyltransferase involved in cell wall biosynthesis